MNRRNLRIISVLLFIVITAFAQRKSPALSGKIITKEKEEVPFATVYLKGTTYGCATNEEGLYHLVAPEGDYTLVVSAIGYETVEKPIKLVGDRQKMNIVLTDSEVQLDEVVIMAGGVSRVNRSAFNAVAIGTENLQNSTKNLSEALARTPGLKLRESGGVGSDMSMMLDGFTGKHVKIFIDGVPQEGVGEAFGLNNIPINYAERIEVYKGVVPVGFGTDALGGVINRKYYNQYNSGPVSTSASGSTDYVLLTSTTSSLGYGAAGGVLPGNEDLVAAESGGSGGGQYESGTLTNTQYPDECWVAVFADDSFTNPTLIKTDQIIWAAGRMRSAYYQTIWAADNGDVYVFSPSFAKSNSDPRQQTKLNSGVARIKAGASEFDSTYGAFDIEAASNGNPVYRCWHITEDYFLLQMYTDGLNVQGKGTTKMAIFKGDSKQFTYVAGLPDPDVISSFSKSPYNENGVCYTTVVTTDGAKPTIYKIDPKTATATAGLTVEADEIGALGLLRAK